MKVNVIEHVDGLKVENQADSESYKQQSKSLRLLANIRARY